MASSIFEGFEKRLELRFSISPSDSLGLRRLPPSAIDQVLHAVQCTVVTAVGNSSFDAYVLSESSLFVYPDRIIIKTCGTTRLLLSLPLLLHHATPTACRYSRGPFLFPSAQPSPHSSFREEALFLDEHLPPSLLRHRKASVLAHSWHVYSASVDLSPPFFKSQPRSRPYWNSEIRSNPLVQYCPFWTRTRSAPQSDKHVTLSRRRHFTESQALTLEVCMTDLDRSAAARFFRPPEDKRSGHDAGREMTEAAGIDAIVPNALICDHAFDPCGYSMNSLGRRGRYSTIHVTPEEGYSYASFECVVGGEREVGRMLRRVAEVFRPGNMSVVVSGGGGEWSSSVVVSALEKEGMDRRSRAEEEFPGAGMVTYQTFVASRRKS